MVKNTASITAIIILLGKIAAILIFFGILAMVAKPLYATLKEQSEQKKKEREKIPTAKNKKEIALEELSKIWRIECYESEESMKKHEEEIAEKVKAEIIENLPEETAAQNIAFQNIRLQSFYEKYIKGKKSIKPEAYDVIVEIMKLLDEKGSCPSVVQNPVSGDSDDIRRQKIKNEYDLLSKVTLLDHSLNVAEELLSAHKYSYTTMARDIIAALGHDLGKIPEFHNNKYATGDHPTISLLILSQITGFKGLPCVESVKDAIKRHHKSPQQAFSRDLKSADQRAREKELETLMEDSMKESRDDSPTPEPDKPDIPQDDSNSKPGGDVPNIDPIVEHARQEKDDDESKKNKVDDSGVNIEWFSPDKMLMLIKKRYLNKTTGNGFDAFSTKNGYVFVQTGRIMDIFREMAEQEGRLQDYDIVDKEQRRAINLKIVNIMRENGYIAEELVHKGYFGGQFDVKFKPGTFPNGEDVKRGYYTPFYANAFSDDMASLEAMKEGVLRNVLNVEIAKKKE